MKQIINFFKNLFSTPTPVVEQLPSPIVIPHTEAHHPVDVAKKYVDGSKIVFYNKEDNKPKRRGRKRKAKNAQ